MCFYLEPRTRSATRHAPDTNQRYTPKLFMCPLITPPLHCPPSKLAGPPPVSPSSRLLYTSFAGSAQNDSTVYGTGRASTKSFYTHHVAAISSAIVRADALLVRNAAASLAFQLAHAPGPS